MTPEALEEIKAAATAAGGHAWIKDTAENIGKNWLIASFGYDDREGADFIVTTDNIRASEYDGDGANADATHASNMDPATTLTLIKALEDRDAEIERLREACASVLKDCERSHYISAEALFALQNVMGVFEDRAAMDGGA